MKILVDIGHPAHVHYFRNFIAIMQEKGHEFLVVARDKEVSHQLLNAYGIPYVSRGKGKNGAIGKIVNMLKGDLDLYKLARKFKPDYFLSFGSPIAAQVAWYMRKPHISFDDTEHAKIAKKLYKPFTKAIFTPACYFSDLGEKQIRLELFMELCYLHPNYFRPNKEVYKVLNLSENEPYVLLRFVSWNANHDIGQSGLDLDTKRKIIEKLQKNYRVFISSEGELPADLEQYRIRIPVEMMHDALAYATLFIGEGATMASECAMLETPAIYVNSLNMGYMQEQDERGLIFSFRSSAGVLDKIDELLQDGNLKEDIRIRWDKMINEKIDPVKMLVYFFEHYPESIQSLKNDPQFQFRFK